jgi:hypothetical protein
VSPLRRALVLGAAPTAQVRRAHVPAPAADRVTMDRLNARTATPHIERGHGHGF